MDPIEIFLEIGKSLTIVHFVPGRIRLRVSSKSIPLIKQFSKHASISNISVEQLINSLNGVNKVKINPIAGSITIEYDPNEWSKPIWESLCSGENNPLLTQKVTDAISSLSA